MGYGIDPIVMIGYSLRKEYSHPPDLDLFHLELLGTPQVLFLTYLLELE
jgi:hypothetical protein